MSESEPKQRTFVFFHPDLGIGGAERLVVDAAVGLQKRGHKVVIYTSYCDKNHCFEEARDGTLDVRVRGNVFPASIFSRLTILCSIIRQLHLILYIFLSGELVALNPSTLVVDQLSAGLPLLQYLFPEPGILFYCHFPDMLLARGREKLRKRLYRAPFDWLEQWSTGYAHAIAVNSLFTKTMVEKTMPALAARDLRVVYPAIETPADKAPHTPGTAIADTDMKWIDDGIILSINRFERKKDIDLAIKAYAAIPAADRAATRLVIAGGYDPRVAENVDYHNDLVALASSLDLPSYTAKTTITALSAPPIAEAPVIFLLSVPGALKSALLAAARLLVYTPSHEHFGIVPLEAMAAGVPVVACNNGGPLETVQENSTGWHCDPADVPAWTAVMRKMLPGSPTAAGALAVMKKAGPKRAEYFSVANLAERVDRISRDIDDTPRRRPLLTSFLNILNIFLTFGLGLLVAQVLFP
ncbi:hypothetical protein TD95_004822 [Thielaviopsis punctulata]|uniref:Alpha-1,3/1,6-mannosyltransferase ALG2 n=1 Tax=Thielaviopsis punctulata TaxID=72032 RepID=A0A0F4ZEU5_9PEZI|nr:hypothetical protein TD95_004822 [Thielaviopsis punctulata]